jgi:hypothetical protein
MITNLPLWIDILFILTVFITIGLFYWANGKSKKLLLIVAGWNLLQSVLAYSGFYQNTATIPPRFIFVLLPTTLLIIYGLLSKQRNVILAKRNIKISTFMHIIRIPIEIVLFYLFVHQMIPELMTFEGRNFDILAGITAPIIGILYIKGKIANSFMILWNIICLGLVLFITFNGILSSELPIQQFAFEQPNRAMIYFPYVLLPAVIVPIVIYTHITDIMKLSRERAGVKSLNIAH